MCDIFQVCDEPVAYMYDTPGKNSWFTTMWQLKAAMLVINIINISSKIDMKMKFSSQRKEMLLFGHHDITCKPAINCKHL